MVFLAAVLLFVPWLGETLFYSKGEPREAIVAMSMLQSGNWTLPLCYGTDLPYKPPFLAWLIAIFSAVFNGGHVSEFTSRLPSALAVIAMVMAGYSWARKIHGPRFGMVFAFVTMTSFEVFRAGMACRVDMVLTAMMVIPIYIMYNLHEGGRNVRFRFLRWLAAWAMLSCAVLTKGPVGALLPCFAFGIYCLLRHDNFWLTLGRMLGLAVAACIVPALWYYAAWLQGGQEFYDLMYEEVLGRLLGTMSYDSHVNPWWYNFVTLVAGLLPWTVLLLMTLFGIRRYRRAPFKTPGLFCAVVAAVIILFYCIPESKRSVYLLPAYPFIAYGITCVLLDKSGAKIVRAFAWFIAVLAIVAPITAIVLKIVGVKGLAIGTIPCPGYITLALAVGAGVAWIVNRHSPVGHCVVGVWALWLAYVSGIMPAVLNPKSDYKAMERLSEAPGEYVYDYNGGESYRYYSLDFYLDERMRHIDSAEELRALPSGTYVLLPATCDTTGLGADFHIEPLLEKSADHRHRTSLAIKK